jgi:hypothetical protein
MEIPATPSPDVVQSKLNQYKRAALLAQITIFHNLIEVIDQKPLSGEL